MAVPLPKLADELEARIARRLKKLEPSDPRLRETLLRIGFLLETQAKLNVRRQGIIDTGRLFNSLRSFFYTRGDRAGVAVGSFGVPYASMHEFGGPFTDRQRRAMFASLRERGRLKGKGYVDKNVIQGQRMISRPYLRPAVLTHRGRIIDLIRELMK